MKVTFLGTGTSQGVPIITCTCVVCSSTDPRDNRLRTSVLIETERTNIVIDTGPDFRQQMLRENVHKVDAILFTHGHKDHTAGFDDIRGFNWKTKEAMEVYSNEEVEIVLKRDFHYAFAEHKYPGVPNLNLNVIQNKNFMIRDIPITPIEVLHYKLPVFGYRIGDFSYITDANFISESEKEKLKGSKVLVLNALRKSEHISHFTLDQAVAIAREIGAEQTYLIHMSHQMGLHAEVDSELPEGINLAYDGLAVTL
ncbi:MAG: MBL fold metallo-hydrolase [Bacteroidota bacterium]|jgi:phosphoribosyl 1,2-cyclic phosphate phosphodiesterase|nr:MBL fold metallo-hydrolase [Bacteroidia bacterium]